MSKKEQEKARKRLERGRENLERNINSAILSEGSILNQPEDLGRTSIVNPQEVVDVQRGETFARPSAGDRIERLVNEIPEVSYPSIADRAERQAIQFNKEIQGRMDPGLADRAEREINRRMAELVTPEERIRYSPSAVARLNAEEDALAEAISGRQLEAEQRGQEIPAVGMYPIRGGLVDYVSEQRAQQTVRQPEVQSLKGQTERKTFVLEKYPTLMAAADKADLSEDEVRDMVNFTLAFDAARLIGQAISDDRRAAIFATMSPAMQALVRDIVVAGIEEDKANGRQPENYAARIAEAQQSGRDLVKDATFGLAPLGEYIGGAVSKAVEQQRIIGEQSTGNTGQDVLRTAWNWTLGPSFDAWFTGAENVQRGFRAGTLAIGTELGEYSWRQAWDAAEKDQFSQSRLDELRSMYGAKPVDIIVEVMNSRANNDPDIIGTVIQKYQDDPEALDFIDKAINGVRNDQEMADLITSVRAAQTGDTGNVIAQSSMSGEGIFSALVPFLAEDNKEIGVYEQSAAYSIIRNTTNVGAVFILDPLLFAGVVRGGVLAARYGLARVALEANAPVKGTKVFQEPRVRNFFNTMGGQLQDINRLEADEGVAAMAPANASVRSMYKRYFTGEALDDMRIFLKSRPEANPAAALEEYFSNVENIQHIVVGQSARRGRQIQVPHMTAATARVKLMSMKLRGLTYPGLTAREFLDNVFFEGFSESMPAAAAEDFARIISSPGGDKYVGRGFSDFTIRDGEMVRNLTGRLVLDRLPKSWGLTQRYGWKRSHTPAAIAARIRRLAAIWPDTSKPLKVSDGSDAGRIQNLVEAAGMPRHFALIVREMWANADEPTRRMMGEGIARSYGYARGVDVVSPEGKALIDQIGPGAARGDQYAASLPDLPAMKNQARMTAQRRIDEAIKEGQPLNVSLDDLADEILQTEIIPSAGQRNPSMINGTPGAIVLSDTTDFMAFPDITKLEAFTARSSLLTALTGQNIGMSNVTDLWVLGTLAGPRFQMRNAIEDMALYILTTGSLRGYFKGRKISTARREAQAREVTKPFQEIKGMKLGILKTSARNIGSLFSDEMASIILPNLSKKDLARANALAKAGNREELAKLVAKAYLRQRLRFLPGRRRLIGRSVDEAELSPEQLQELRWIEQAIEYGDVLRGMDEAAESGRHLADGFAPRSGDMDNAIAFDLVEDDDIRYINGQAFKVNRYDVKYENQTLIPGNNQSIKAWRHNLAKIVHGDGPKGQWTMELLPRYFDAVANGRTSEAKDIVEELANRVANADAKFGYGEKFMIQKSGGFEALAQASLDNAYQLFSTQTGNFNRALYNRMTVKTTLDDGTEETVYALWGLDDAGEKMHLLSAEDLGEIALTEGHPLMVNARVSTEVLTPVNNNQWTNAVWQAMGRSLARMTREPIFMANYLDARKVMAPFEAKLTETIGKKAAEKWAVDAATERAFRLTMNYVDNPAVRSQFAWQIRNVARFYRALEDFNRRLIRTARNEPMAFAKLALAWNALDDSGFVWEDEFGEKYFVWPGTRQAFEAINGIMNMFGQEVYSPGLPLAFTSRVNMLTPSADPNALLPTFSGPYAAIAIMPLMRALPGLRSLENEFFGEYTGSRSLLETVFPSHVNRFFSFVASQRGTTESRLNETDSIFANSARSAVQAYAAAGLWDPSKSYTGDELEQHRERIDRTAQWIVALKAIFSPVFPAALTTNVDTATDFAKSIGIDGMRPAFVQLLRANEGDISAASIQWLKMNPDLSPFTVGTTKSPDSKGYYGPFQETVEWIEGNQEALDLSVAGASYFAPIDGTQTLAAWSFLMANDFKARESTKNYMNEVITAEGKTLYYSLRSQWIDAKKKGDPKADARWETAKEELYAAYPLLRRAISGDLATTQRSSIDDMISEVDGIRKVAEYYKSEGKLDERGKRIYDLISLRDQASLRLQGLNDRAPNYTKERDKISEQWENVVESFSRLYPDDRQWSSLLYVLSESLVQGWGRYV